LIKAQSDSFFLNSAAESIGALEENRTVTPFYNKEKLHVFRFSAAPSWLR
jgi:hypothetical protein